MQLKTSAAREGNTSVGMQGFTLIELSIVTIISGLIFVAAYDLYYRYLQQQITAATQSNLQAAASQISNFFASQRRYPCPSDRTVPKTNPLYATEADPQAVANGGCNLTNYGFTFPIPAGGECVSGTNAPVPAGTNGVGGICAFQCSVPIGPNACGDGTGGANNIVVIGGIPFNTIQAVDGHDSNGMSVTYDGYGMKMDYVITYQLTSTATYKYNYGAITLHDENGNDTAGMNNHGHYGIISHGPDRIGSYSDNGQIFSICGSHVPQSYGTGDDQNCSNNDLFIQGIENDSPSAQHYDDSVYFVTITSGGLWKQLVGSADMVNINPGMVNIGTANAPPTATVGLNVGDPLGGTAGVIQAINPNSSVTTPSAGSAGLKAANICDANMTNCFPVKNIVSPAPVITCPAGQVMRGISNSLADCTAPQFARPLPNQTCCVAGICTGHWMTGIGTDGTIICE